MKTIKTAVLLSAMMTAVPVCVQAQSSQNTVRYYEEMVGTLSRQVKSMQDENAIFSATTADLKRRMARLEAENRSLAQEIRTLRKQVAADAEVRKVQLNNLANQLERKPAKKKTETPNVEQSASEDQEYIEHVVQKGTTLSALAKAYKVSVRDIEKANKLNKGRIYAGQKLLIPVATKK